MVQEITGPGTLVVQNRDQLAGAHVGDEVNVLIVGADGAEAGYDGAGQ